MTKNNSGDVLLCITGKYQFTVDTKRRVNIPAPAMLELFKQTQIYMEAGGVVSKDSDAFKKFKESDVTFHITRGPNDCLFVYPRDVFMQKAARLNSHFGSRGTENNEERRYFLETMADAQPVRSDQQGRVTVPQEHLDYAGITKHALVIGAFDHLEIWDPEVYDAFISGSTVSPQERVKKFGWAERDITPSEQG
ncbi:hypothetical protein KAR48_15775 [bacterium]|nr:hypothetical protein [bacterium]